MGALKSDFSRSSRFPRFYSKILVEKYILTRGSWNFLFKRFGDQTNAKLCQHAESAILCRGFSEIGHTTGLQLKNRESSEFWLKIASEDFMLYKDVACSFLHFLLPNKGLLLFDLQNTSLTHSRADWAINIFN